MADTNTQFDYLLNAFEQASQADEPAKEGYGEKRRALLAHVRELEANAERYAHIRDNVTADERGYLLEMAQGQMAPWQVDWWVDSARARSRNTLSVRGASE